MVASPYSPIQEAQTYKRYSPVAVHTNAATPSTFFFTWLLRDNLDEKGLGWLRRANGPLFLLYSNAQCRVRSETAGRDLRSICYPPSTASLDEGE
jgi:hypothetical protein